MAAFVYDSLKTKYDNFKYPVAVILINDQDLSKNTQDIRFSDLEVEMTCGFEASIASFRIYNCYDMEASLFQFDAIKKYVCLGSSVVIAVGYGFQAREIFRGFISRVNFSYVAGDTPGVEITAMDVKGIMMSNTYSRQLTAKNYSDAVKEILTRTSYSRLEAGKIIEKMDISDTPDKKQTEGQNNQATDKTIEMVCESDYEFVVKAAKKFNYEFFSIGGTVYFRKAKENKEILLEAGPNTGLREYEISYDLTGLVEKVEVRGMDAGQGKSFFTSKKLQNKISNGNKAKSLLAKSQKVYIDPTIRTKKEAEYRAEYLVEDISYRYGTLEAEFIGLPELAPGRFLRMKDLGTAVSNTFYLTTVRHIMDTERGFITKVTGKTAGMEQSTV